MLLQSQMKAENSMTGIAIHNAMISTNWACSALCACFENKISLQKTELSINAFLKEEVECGGVPIETINTLRFNPGTHTLNLSFVFIGNQQDKCHMFDWK